MPKPVITSAKLSHSRTLSASTRSDIRSRTLPEAVARPARPLSKGATALVDNPALKKPEFNSYKQHFSPKKTKQVPSSTSTLSRSGGGGGSSSEASAEGRHLQDELLQLTLLHDTAATTLRAYQKSITLQLSAWSDDLSQQLQTLASLEGESQAKANAYVAKSWLHAGREQRSTTSAASNRLLVLAHSIRELTCITKPFGPLDSVMRLFEEWQISAASTSPNGASLSQLAPLDPQWSDRLTSVQKRVQTCADSLADLQGPSVSSSIGLLIHMHSRLADQVLQEIAICRDIEVLILRREQEWMEAAVTRALSEVEGHGYGQASHLAERKGIWDRREEDQLPRR
ncbi:hypothetical protein A1O3_10329 [Capronia epimyces CBS 606.96]|uniref:Uncharacterized protein n=1 Tax=Capronia epimyces CBS 606.96 TaxID=1182542 RepID=W9XJL7_9EURO|nr:uncharacterized protein A1O3_10329 [Capronia epimyces CBS 606.96]EXJ77171.1 hypothetical protein A1O3_10329 [Capronia epimyces CBS 606.96]